MYCALKSNEAASYLEELVQDLGTDPMLATSSLQLVAPCASSRGGLFKSNDSTSWSTQSLSNAGVFELTTEYAESYLGLDGVGAYGFDTLSLGLNTGLPTLSRALIAGLSTNNYWLGSLGLSRWPFNFSNFDDPQPSLLTTLFKQSQIPSLSWAYTAGAAYRNSYGSLTLGGYDTTRHGLNTSSFPFGPDQAKDPLVTLGSITYDTLGSIPLLTQDIDILVDSMVTHLWLPTTVCHAFEQAFNLTWNETLELYVLDDNTHQQLLAQKPTFKFTLTDSNHIGNTVDISLPYAAFDLSITQPYVEQRYFPLKRAHNDSQFTLGESFSKKRTSSRTTVVETSRLRKHSSLVEGYPSSWSQSIPQALIWKLLEGS
ncbi:acid protease [Aureobasidium pullulans]|uniref:Acid protease n=1 Tax=Aureobasidium pullulans TaxID=5580 RepID=A0A4S8XFP9_AURPU|nr:acid protease [Aureobasidium pullulans]